MLFGFQPNEKPVLAEQNLYAWPVLGGFRKAASSGHATGT